MPAVQKQLLLPFSAEQMFDLVDDVEGYPQFLPWCGGTRVERVSDSLVKAAVQIRFKGLQQSFTTRNAQSRPTQILLNLEEGPFSELQGQWAFKPLATDACRVNFELRYEFSSRLLGLAIAPVFDQIAGGFVDAFVLEAERRYGA